MALYELNKLRIPMRSHCETGTLPLPPPRNTSLWRSVQSIQRASACCPQRQVSQWLPRCLSPARAGGACSWDFLFAFGVHLNIVCTIAQIVCVPAAPCCAVWPCACAHVFAGDCVPSRTVLVGIGYAAADSSLVRSWLVGAVRAASFETRSSLPIVRWRCCVRCRLSERRLPLRRLACRLFYLVWRESWRRCARCRLSECGATDAARHARVVSPPERVSALCHTLPTRGRCCR